MVRWRYCLVLALLLLLPDRIGSKIEDDDDDQERSDANEEEDDDYEDDEDDEQADGKPDKTPSPRRNPSLHTASTATKLIIVTRTEKRRPLECYVCSYKSETPLRACLDPTKFRVHTITCHSTEDKCFTSVVSKGNSYDSVVRGCQSGCVGSPDTTCCEMNRCNSQAFAMPAIAPRAFITGKASPRQPNVLFFISVLLVLQTVVKVTIV